MKGKKAVTFVFIGIYGLFIGLSFLLDFGPGKGMGQNFFEFSYYLLTLLPCAFILIGLFEVWVKRETIEKHLGENAGIGGYFWIVLLAGTTIGGLYTGLPVAHSLYRKGARLNIVFTYIGAVAVCRVPMTLFEASFLGVKFTAVRWLVSLPLIVLTSSLLGRYMKKRELEIKEGR